MEIDGPALRRELEGLAGHPITCRGMLFGEPEPPSLFGPIWRFRCDQCAYVSEPFRCELIDDPRPPYAPRYT